MSSVPAPSALAGLKVLDLAALFPAPLLAAMLGDHGADVVKVEPPNGDGLRFVGTPGPGGTSTAWAFAGRNKRSVVLDPSDPTDLDQLIALTAVADVVIVNQPRTVLERWRCTPELIADRNPRAVVVALTAFGLTGPRASVGGNGTTAEAFAGFTHLNGQPDGPPTHPSLALGDTLGAISAFNGVLAALYWRDANGGTGQFVDATLFEPVLSLLGSTFASWDPADPPPTRNGSRIANAAPRNVYRAADNRWVSVSAPTDAQVQRLLATIGADDDGRFTTAASRVGAVADELDELVAVWIATHTAAEVVAAFSQARLPVEPVNTVADVVADPHVVARHSLTALADERVVPAPTPALRGSPARFRRDAPALGADTADVLHEWLGTAQASSPDHQGMPE